MGKLRILREVLGFSKREKKFWLIPVIVILVLYGFFLIFAQSSAIAPFTYTLF